ncbi:ABC transporter permease [Burkholderia pseudomultivorans]|uniref:ABC transporter permease n=1 Tax=Burkholderia pseudomultivorans TaxID=1207504 RepID=UPI00188EB10E|nr:ABC transporter permease [Burkholderia pseudomultivorans]MBF5012395.1 ABC transporter permease [Burkholderia pseudomultivorans]
MTARNAAYGTHASRTSLSRRLPAYAARAAALALLLVLLLRPAWLQGLFAPFADNGAPVIYDRASLLDLTLAHLGTVALSSLIGTLVAVTAGIAVTRPSGADFLPVARSIVDIGQTFPPVAVLALAVPAVGFGLKPVLIALVLYGLLPVFESTIAGLEDVPRDVVDAARGMGMSGWQQLVSVELPLAFPVIVNGIRLAVVINLGTATIGSTVAARGLGDVIIAGLQTSNTAFVLQGGVIVGLLAVLVSDAIGALAKIATARRA